ncbi:hypothetical protein ACPEGA_02590, partial [Escherichia coli]
SVRFSPGRYWWKNYRASTCELAGTHYGEELQGPTVDGNELREETRYLNVDYSAVTGLLVQVARETDDRVTALEEENTTLRQNLATAGTRISTLENQVSELVALVRQLTGSEH